MCKNTVRFVNIDEQVAPLMKTMWRIYHECEAVKITLDSPSEKSSVFQAYIFWDSLSRIKKNLLSLRFQMTGFEDNFGLLSH